MAEPRAWTRRCWIDLCKQVAGSGSSTNLSLRAITRDVTITLGGRPMTATALVNDGFIDALENEGKATLAFTGYVTTAGDAEGVTVNSIAYLLGLHGLFYEGTDTTGPLSVDSDSIEPTPLRMSFLWTNDTTATNSTGATASTSYGFRHTYANGYMTQPPSFEWSGNPRVLEFSAEFEFTPRNRFAFPNYHFESGRAEVIPALSDYNVTNYGETVASRTW